MGDRGGGGGGGGPRGGNNYNGGGGNNNGGGGGQAAQTGGDAVFFLRPEHQRVLRRMFRTPFTTPNNDIVELSDGGQGLPVLRNIYTFNVPCSAFAANPTSFRDLIANNLGNAPNRHLRDILLLFSSIVTDENVGTIEGQDNVDPNADFMDVDDLGAVADNGNNNNNNNNNNGRGRGRHGNGGGVMGGTGRIDRRGEIQNDGRGLMFLWGQKAFPKVIPCVEKLCSPSRRPMAYRFWFFVFDPVFDINKAFVAQIQRNLELYQGANLPDNMYLSHATIQSTNDYVERIVLPYLQQGLDNEFVPDGIRNSVDSVITKLCNNETMRGLNIPLTNPAHPAHPAHIFGKLMGFSLYMDGVCSEQRDPSNYFQISANHVRLQTQLEQDGWGPLHEGGVEDADDADDPDLVVGNTEVDFTDDVDEAERTALRAAMGLPPLPDKNGKRKSTPKTPAMMRPSGSDPMDGVRSDDGDDLDVVALMERITSDIDALSRRKASNAEAATNATAAAAAASDNATEKEQAGEEGEESLLPNFTDEDPVEVARISANVLSLRGVPSERFGQFIMPEVVCRISSNQFGRMLLNTPLPDRIQTLSANGADVLGSRFEEADLFDKDEVGDDDRDESDQYFNDHSVTTGVLYNRRRLEIKNALKPLGRDHRIEVSEDDITNLNKFKDKMREIRASVGIRRQISRDNNAQKEVMEILRQAAGVTFQNAVAGEDDMGLVYGGFLPETLNQRLSQSEFQAFAAKHVFLQLRYKNLRTVARIMNTHKEGVAREKALTEFRVKAAAEFWDVFLNSNKLSPSLIEVRNWFKKQAPMEQWGEHLDLMQNLSSFGNMMLTILSRYNGIFRGSTNQQAFMLTTFCHYGTFEYDWGIKENLLLMGKGAAGKSYVFEVVEILTCPGTMSSWSHTTDKAYSTSTSFSDQTFCMHEAPLSYIGTDKYGKSTLADPVLKDRLAKQRSGTRYFTKDEQGNRITKDEQVMIMGNIIMATNEGIPPEDSPLMQRFIIMAVNDMKRPDFNIGDNSQPLKDLVSTSDNKRHIQFSHLLSFYVLVLCKMIMCGIIPEPSTDASEILVKDILAAFTKQTRISTSHPRKRKMIMDMARITCYIYTVHMSLFSLFADEYCRDHELERAQQHNMYAGGGDDNDGNPREQSRKTRQGIYKAFTPDVLVHGGIPRLYVTDEMIVYVLTLLSFMFESEHRYVILDTIVSVLNPAVHKGNPFRLQEGKFRIMANPDLIGVNTGAARSNNASHNNNYYNNNNANNKGSQQQQQQPQQQQQQQQNRDDDEDAPFIIDPRYACIAGENLTTIHSNIMHKISQNTPSILEVQRTLKDTSGLMYEAHPARLVPTTPNYHAEKSDDADEGDAMDIDHPTTQSIQNRVMAAMSQHDENAQSGFDDGALDHVGRGHQQQRHGGEDYRTHYSNIRDQYAMRQSTTLSASNGKSNTSTSAAAIRNVRSDALRSFIALPTDDRRAGNQNESMADSMLISEDTSDGSGQQQQNTRAVPKTKVAPRVVDTARPMTVQMKNTHRREFYRWELDETAPTKSEPVVLCVKDPTDPRGRNVMVCVLIEYVMNAPRGDAMVNAIKSVLSTNIMPPQGRTYLTGLSYVHYATPESAPEIMPQFCRTLTVPYSDKPFVHRYVRIGTRDSQAFLRSTLRFGNADDHSASIANHMATSLGLRMEPNKDFNEYCVNRHFHRVGYVLSETENHMAPIMYLPAVESAQLRKLTDRQAAKANSNLELTKVYPDDCVREQLTLRRTDRMDIHANSEYTSRYFESSNDLISTIDRIGQGEEHLLSAANKKNQTTLNGKKSKNETVLSIPLDDMDSLATNLMRTRRRFTKSDKFLHNSLSTLQTDRLQRLKSRKEDLLKFAENLGDDTDDSSQTAFATTASFASAAAASSSASASHTPRFEDNYQLEEREAEEEEEEEEGGGAMSFSKRHASRRANKDDDVEMAEADYPQENTLSLLGIDLAGDDGAVSKTKQPSRNVLPHPQVKRKSVFSADIAANAKRARTLLAPGSGIY